MPEIVTAIQSQNTVNPAGQIGGEPAPKGQEFTYSVRAQGRLTSPEEFERDRRPRDSGRRDRARQGRRPGRTGRAGLHRHRPPEWQAERDHRGVSVARIECRPGGRRGQSAARRADGRRLPHGVDYAITLDTTRAVTEGIKEIVETLLIAIVLVIVVVYVFLQGWRATLIPLLAVPVSLVGTFVVFPAFGFSINTLSLFGLVLAIGLVVDDAIVVVEAVEHHIEEGMSPKDATFKAMEEISAPVVGIALVLSAVFIPTAFIPGITGRLYQQFAVTIAISVCLSAFNALTLSPALSALLLRPRTRSGGLLRRFFDWFNRGLRARDGRLRARRRRAHPQERHRIRAASRLWSASRRFFGARLPSSFLPDEDQGYMFLNLQLPSAASLQRTEATAREIEDMLAKTPGVESTTSVIGFSLLSLTRSTYNAFFFVTLKEWKERQKREEQYQFIRQSVNQKLAGLRQGIAFSFSPPAIPGVGTSGGFTFILEDRSGSDVAFLASNTNKFLAAARKRPELASVNDDVPAQRAAAVHRRGSRQGAQAGCRHQGCVPNDSGVHGRVVHQLLQPVRPPMAGVRRGRGCLSRSGRERRRVLRSEPNRRHGAAVRVDADSSRVPALNSPCATTCTARRRSSAAPRPATAPPRPWPLSKRSSPRRCLRRWGTTTWGFRFRRRRRSKASLHRIIFGFSLLVVFLVLAALYESWSLPFSVLLSTPVAVFGAFFVLWLRRTVLGSFLPPYMVQIETDVYSQIGLVMLIGLTAKNAILIVEFAKDAYEGGQPLADAALAAARLRLRPILMTSFAFVLGCVPLWTASGAGSVARQIMGTTVIGGMLAATLIAVFIIPVLFVAAERIGQRMTGTGVSPVTPPLPAHGDR